MTAGSHYGAVFFDLDGTLVDTAPDMVAVLLDLQRSEGLDPLPYAVARSHVSNGAAGLVNLAFPAVSPDEHERLRLAYLDRYEQSVCVHSTLFPGLDRLLDHLDAGGTPWGVVTNKPARMTGPLLSALGLEKRAACIVSGDTIPERKPDPAPLLLACRQTGVPPDQSIYVGDAARDIQAGRAVNMLTVAVSYGYIVPGDDAARWNAHHVVGESEELAHFLEKGVNLKA